MAQQPNIELTPGDRPRSEPRPAAARRWAPSSKPGVITAPNQVPRGDGFGTPGPDTGFAYRLIRAADLPDRTEPLEQVLAALMGARAALFGRAPTKEDLEVARLLCGLGEVPREDLAERRQRWVEATAHEKPRGRKAVAEVGTDLLRLDPTELSGRLARD